MAETDKIYFPSKHFEFPIGYILMSATNINPSTFLGYGTWELIGNGRTILGASDTDEGEETGGSMTKALTLDNIPGHNHSIASHTHQIPAHNHTASSNSTGAHAHTITINSGGAHTHNINISSLYIWGSHKHTRGGWNSKTCVQEATNDGGSGAYYDGSWALAKSAGSHGHTASSASNGAHAHTITVANKAAFNTGSGGSGNTGSTGSGTSFDITPSYIKLFIWKRIE